MAFNPHPTYLKAAADLSSNPGQWTAYQSKGNCVMLAGPGSGKTKTLTVKIAQLLNEEIKFPRGIACVTYSAECARELKQRLTQLGVEENRRIFVGTVHGFCLKHVITPFAKLAGLNLPAPLVVADDKTQYRFFEEALDRGGVVRENPRYVRLGFDRYRRTYLDRDDASWLKKDSDTARMIEAYESDLHRSGYVDFDDMILMGRSLIKGHPWIRHALRAKFPVFVIDEYQDLGVPLHDIVLSLAFEGGIRIVAVGDPDQSIYGFTGANPQLLRDLADRDNIETVELKMNYRSGKNIVRSSVVVLGEHRDFETTGNYDGLIYPLECPNGVEEQAKLICSKIIPESLKRHKNRSLGDIAVLYLDKNDALIVTKAVKDHDFKYIGGDKEARYTNTPLTRWLEDCAAWCAGGWQTATPKLSSLVYFWTFLNEANNRSQYKLELRRSLLTHLWSHRNPDEPLIDWLTTFLDVGLKELLEINQIRPDEKASLENLLKAAGDKEKLGEMTIGGFGKLRGASDHLNLVTLHSSKGLEFDVVIMFGLEQGRIPNFRATTIESKREPRRLFYVGLTRARYEVHLLYSGWYNDLYGRIHANGPSEFVTEIQNNLDEAENILPG